MKRLWKVSIAALAGRLFDLRLISAWHYRSLFIEISQRGWRRFEPRQGDIPQESSQILRKVDASLRETPEGTLDSLGRCICTCRNWTLSPAGWRQSHWKAAAGGSGERAASLRLID